MKLITYYKACLIFIHQKSWFTPNFFLLTLELYFGTFFVVFKLLLITNIYINSTNRLPAKLISNTEISSYILYLLPSAWDLLLELPWPPCELLTFLRCGPRYIGPMEGCIPSNSNSIELVVTFLHISNDISTSYTQLQNNT